MDISLEFLNSSHFVPRKDHNLNRLVAGSLQLSAGTLVLVNELALKPGQLTANGIKNLQALAMMITRQSVDYDFEFCQIAMPTNVQVVVCSEGKTLLPVDAVCPVVPQTETRLPALTEEAIQLARQFLGAAKYQPFEIAESERAAIEQDFVTMRQADHKAVNGETLHTLLVLGRWA